MREQKTKQALIGTSYSFTGLKHLDVFGFAYFLLNLPLNSYIIKTFERKYFNDREFYAATATWRTYRYIGLTYCHLAHLSVYRLNILPPGASIDI